MFKWAYSETVKSHATPPQVWAIWTDIQRWPTWNTEIEWLSRRAMCTHTES